MVKPVFLRVGSAQVLFPGQHRLERAVFAEIIIVGTNDRRFDEDKMKFRMAPAPEPAEIRIKAGRIIEEKNLIKRVQVVHVYRCHLMAELAQLLCQVDNEVSE